MHAGPQAVLTLDDATAQAAADVLRGLADDTRLKILWVLMQQETSVNALAELVGANPPAVSQHLTKLRAAGLVQVRREASFAYYHACDEHIGRIVADVVDHAADQVRDEQARSAWTAGDGTDTPVHSSASSGVRRRLLPGRGHSRPRSEQRA